ncbi:acetyltransferase [Ectothiorhodospira haloalkaliphila]|uniref:Acetyltransferase n=1 Tax=Ectothiorhodospira haloalkaliphila TaxID=421628 RepID=W8KR87_9GAMM|nr:MULTISPECIES: GNAT family N-acetyltransferase [Ectothiorhodospira]AHK79532.1 acetyltransferase [Ectothiorhodospira haloalkaliphila]MCG5492988.1 GNAT family N-acetyltransferase [Ectothiorhodospira variabilis]MCG5497291.1 GNAT family N-acetyltransferase [Ectothiorhodospira variabilis]MCG5502317.1 GNAT family N-acetyltransferase [Ectothiorhodospira variabilis]MCG5505917.1 GNAT family N-acetyltransferase [Ectothiorhodospira variabilis]
MTQPPRLERVPGPKAEPYLGSLARLRIRVFRDFPYLYDGDAAYETEYLATYFSCAESVVILARDGDQIVGASTALPLEYETDNVIAPFRQRGMAPERVFYLGESVLLPEYRGQGVGVRFFQEREAHAHSLGRFDRAAFCAVQRPADHPQRPAHYVPLDSFWEKRGYRKDPELVAHFSWKDLDEAEETTKPMTFWVKELRR